MAVLALVVGPGTVVGTCGTVGPVGHAPVPAACPVTVTTHALGTVDHVGIVVPQAIPFVQLEAGMVDFGQDGIRI